MLKVGHSGSNCIDGSRTEQGSGELWEPAPAHCSPGEQGDCVTTTARAQDLLSRTSEDGGDRTRYWNG
jgi:hypothetical protein